MTVEYQPRERLLLLIDAFERSVVDTTRMERDLVKNAVLHHGIEGIEFRGEEPGVLSRRLSLDTLDDRVEWVEKLRQLLAGLRAKVEER